MGGNSGGFSRSQHDGNESGGCGSIDSAREISELGTALGCYVQVSANLPEDVVKHLEYTDNFVLHTKWRMAKPNVRRAFGNPWLRLHTRMRSAPRQINIVLMPSFWVAENVLGFRRVSELLRG
jgi:hypothetical protein